MGTKKQARNVDAAQLKASFGENINDLKNDPQPDQIILVNDFGTLTGQALDDAIDEILDQLFGPDPESKPESE